VVEREFHRSHGGTCQEAPGFSRPAANRSVRSTDEGELWKFKLRELKVYAVIVIKGATR
jgi:hypothetical protein